MAEPITGKIKDSAKKLIKQYGFGFLIEAVPILGQLWPGLTIRTWKELDGNLMGPEGVLMLPIAVLFDLAGFSILIIEVWFDIGIFSTIVDWTGFLIIGSWIFMRSGLLTGGKIDEKAPDEAPGKLEKPPVQKNAPAKTPKK